MRRYLVPPHFISNDHVKFSGDIFHHIFEVCRQDVGSHFEVLAENKNSAFLVEVTEVSKKSALAKIVEKREIKNLPRPYIHLAISIPRFPILDAVIEKAVEMGVKSIQPFFSEYSFVRGQDKISEQKVSRWHKIIASATQQSGRGELMNIENPISWAEFIKKINPDKGQLGLFAYEGEKTIGARRYLSSQKIKNQNISDIWLIVGSEGGFSKIEVAQLYKLGLDPVSIGDQVLRVETACIALISILKYEFDLTD